MKRFAQLSATLFLLLGTLVAQPPEGRRGPGGRGGNPEQMMDRQIASMKEAVGLTDEQATKIRPILMDQQKQMRDIMADGPSDDAREKMNKLQATTREKIAKVLNPEQMEKFDKMMAERRGRRGPGGPGGPPPPQR